MLLAAGTLCEAAEEPALALQRIKAAFLYKFAAYVEWPPNTFPESESPIVIGVAGAEGIAHELEGASAGRTAAGRPVVVRKLARGEKPNSCCHILFIGEDDRGQRAELLAQVQNQPVLTVTDVDGGPPKGSIINFLTAEDRVRFDISRGAAERSGIQLRSQLLGVARRVDPR
jgi:YfiR/HmsC-like